MSTSRRTPRGAAAWGRSPHSKPSVRCTKRRLLHSAMPARTTVVLVSRPERSALREAARASAELADLGIANQEHVDQRIARRSQSPATSIAEAFRRQQHAAIAGNARRARGLAGVRSCRWSAVTSPVFRRCGRSWPAASATVATVGQRVARESAGRCRRLDVLVEDLAQAGPGVVMVMGKGGVGKTTIAARDRPRSGVARACRRTSRPPIRPGRPADIVGETTAGPHGEPHRPRGRGRALRREQAAIGSRPRPRAARVARRRPSLALHRGTRCVPGVLEPAATRPRRVRRR